MTGLHFHTTAGIFPEMMAFAGDAQALQPVTRCHQQPRHVVGTQRHGHQSLPRPCILDMMQHAGSGSADDVRGDLPQRRYLANRSRLPVNLVGAAEGRLVGGGPE